MAFDWRSAHSRKLRDAEKALSAIRNGQTVFIGSGAGEPVLLVDTLARMAERFRDVEIIHLTTARSDHPLASAGKLEHFRFNTFYVGRGLSSAVEAGTADYTPMDISELPRAMAEGLVEVDVALVAVSEPDENGMCSLGVSVDATMAAVDAAGLVIAQVNRNMPVTFGNTMIPVEKIDYLVEGNQPLVEVPPLELDPVSLTIGRHVSRLIQDGAILHLDRAPISAAAMRYLDTKKDLGLHTDILTDDMLRLIRAGVVTNACKVRDRGVTVASMVLGSTALYEAVERTASIELHPIDEVCDPVVISRNEKVVSVHCIDEIDLTGTARVDKYSPGYVRNLPSSRDFISGAHRSKDGFVIMALPSTTADGTRSRIVPRCGGAGVTFSRTKVDYVVTEYGVVNLFGLSLRQRAIALISIAHPKFRRQLLEEAAKLKQLDEHYLLPPEEGCVYPQHYEFSRVFGDGVEIFFRPLCPTDARRLQRLFYRLSPDARRSRYHGAVSTLSYQAAERIAAVDYSRDMAIVGLVGPRLNPRIVAEGRYVYNPENNMGEFDVVVDEEYQNLGIGTFLANYLEKIAYARGLSGVYAEVLQLNAPVMKVLNKAWPGAQKKFEEGYCTYTVRFPEHEVRRPKDSIVVYSGRFGDFSYGEGHPFNPGRARQFFKLLNQQGFLDEPWMRVEEPRMITPQRLVESHEPDFIRALQEANSGRWNERFLRYGLGGDDCPVFEGLFDYVVLYCSATATAVDLITEENANLVFNPLGGFHHAGRDHAEGFCYANDVVMAVDTFLARGFRVAYLDIDAHHGNGVQNAYYRDDRVLVISLHQTGKTLYPWGGFEDEIGEGAGRGFNINVPLPEGCDDEAYQWVFDRIVPEALRRFAPGVLVLVAGADTHKNDPLANLNLTNNSIVHVVEKVRAVCPHMLVLGGGGYNLEATTRAWARLWAEANRIESMPDFMLGMGGGFIGGAGIAGADVVDPAFRISGHRKKAIMEELERVADYHLRNTLPFIGTREG